MPPERTTSLFSMSDRAPHPPGMHLGMRVHPGLPPGAPQAEKMERFSCFSLLSGLLQPGIIPGADFVQETQLPPYFEKLVRTWIKLWGNYMDCLGQADYMDMDYMDIMDCLFDLGHDGFIRNYFFSASCSAEIPLFPHLS